MFGRLERYCADLGGRLGIAPLAVLLERGCGSAADGAALMPEDPMTKSKSRKPDTSTHARLKPSHGKRRESGTRKAAPRKAIRRPRATVPLSATVKRKSQPDTKQAQVIAMLCAPSGTTIDALMRVTGWQQHSVRGFLTAVVRKKFSLDLRSEIIDGGRVYRVVDGAATPAVDTKAKTAA
ncbi:MAG: DUF3489 domain-containing protein [Pseudorhodoplanes sp.]